MRRLFVLGVAGALLASVLALVAGSPVQAANTAGEYLVDTNNDGKPDSRPFAGSDRYETALLLAKHYAGSVGSVSTLILASGETQIDAVSAAGLSGYEDAPVLLTRRDSLPAGVARFIDDQGVSQVFVAGGTAVISDDVIEQLKGLDAAPTVTRVAGADRYATAVEIAKRIQTSQTWCDSNDSAVLLANGDLMPYTSAVLAGPMSYRMDMPLLLTEADDLPSVTAEYIDDNDIDRVVIIGDTDEVSDDVADAVEELGSDVDRYAGDDAAGTSVKIAELMWDDCDGFDVDRTSVMLVNETATVDGVTAGPVAGQGLARNDLAIPILLVGSSLPASVRDWLAAIPAVTGFQNNATNSAGFAIKSHVKLIAVGGTAVVSTAVMAAAVEAGSAGAPVTVKITVDDASRTADQSTDPDRFNLEFSEPVGDYVIDTPLNAWLNRVVYVNGVRTKVTHQFDPGNVWSIHPGATPNCAPNSSLKVVLANGLKFKAGDKIELRTDDTPLGSLGDAANKANDLRRVVQPAAVTVGLKKPAPVAVPVVELVAVEGESKLYLRSNIADGDLTRVGGKISVKTKSGAKVEIENIAVNADVPFVAFNNVDGSGSNAYEPALTLTEAFDHNGDNDVADTREAAGDAYHLRAGDVVTVERGAFVNSAKVSSRYVRAIVAKRVPKFGVTSVVLGSPDTDVNDDKSDDKLPGGLPSDRFQTLSVSGGARGYSSRRPFVTFGGGVNLVNFGDSYAGNDYNKEELVMFAKWDGIAAGAKGNHWVLYSDFADRFDEDKPLEIDVALTTSGAVGKELGRITITFVNGKATNRDVVAALRNHPEVSKNFTVGYTTCQNPNTATLWVPDTPVGANSSSNNAWYDRAAYFYGGVSSVGIEVTFEDWVSSLFDATEPTSLTSGDEFLGHRLRNSVLKAIVPGYTVTASGTNYGDTSSLVSIVGTTALTENHAFAATPGQKWSAATVTFTAPSKTVHIRYTTQNPLKLAALRAGPDGGVVKLAGSYYKPAPAPEGTPVDSETPVAANYLYATKSAQSKSTDTVIDPNELPAQMDDDKSGNALIGTTNTSEPIDFYNRAQSIRVRSGTVPSNVTRYDTSSNLDNLLSLGEGLGATS